MSSERLRHNSDHFSLTSEQIPTQDMSEIESWNAFIEQMTKDYKMDYPRRGKAVIFNHETFNDKKLMPRYGTDLDEKLFIQTLYKLGFDRKDIMILPDKDKKTIERVLWALSKKIDHTENDTILCAVFSHGDRNLLHAKDGVYPVSTLWKYFTDEECPSLKGKPKLFFIQACRGTNVDAGQKVKDKSPSKTTSTKVKRHVRNRSGSSSSRRDEEDEPFVPPHSDPDIMVASSCVDGHCSFRTPSAGSWFIRTWNRVVMSYDNFDNIDIVHLLTEVNCMVAVDQISHVDDRKLKKFHKKKQIPNFNSTLTKRLFFDNLVYNTRL